MSGGGWLSAQAVVGGEGVLDLMAVITQQASLGLFTLQSQKAKIVDGSTKGPARPRLKTSTWSLPLLSKS